MNHLSSDEWIARVCYAAWRAQLGASGVGPLPPWSECPFADDVVTAIRLMRYRLVTGKPPEPISIPSADMITCETWQAIVQVMSGIGPYAK